MTVNDEQDRMWTEADMTDNHDPSICLVGLSKTTEIVIKISSLWPKFKPGKTQI
jgi:hypothetical protein